MCFFKKNLTPSSFLLLFLLLFVFSGAKSFKLKSWNASYSEEIGTGRRQPRPFCNASFSHRQTSPFPAASQQLAGTEQPVHKEKKQTNALFFICSSSPSSCHPFLSLLQVECADGELSDAEKVYAECGQRRPLPWEECILPQRVKRCVKIGEGTFGEVFAVPNASGETVALKVCMATCSRPVMPSDLWFFI